MALTEQEVRDRLDALATLLVHLMPGGWRDAKLRCFACGDDAFATLDGRMLDHRRGTYPLQHAGTLLPRSGAFDLLHRLRDDMYDPAQGTWVDLTFTVQSDREGSWSYRFRDFDEVTWDPQVRPSDVAAELTRYPRPDAAVPGWVRDMVALHEAAVSFTNRPPTPQSEQDLVRELAQDDADLFARARSLVNDYAPGAAGRLLIGRTVPGHWSVVRVEPAWLAVRPAEDGTRVEPFEDARSALAHAIGGVLADVGAEVSTGVLESGRIIERTSSPRHGWEAWKFGENLPRYARTRHSPRPDADGSFVSLEQFNNSPFEHFCCPPGPPPETGGYASVHQIFETIAAHRLPEPRPDAADEPGKALETLQPGMEVDAYGWHEEPFVYTLGTPYTRRNQPARAPGRGEPPHHVYRVLRPITGTPHLLEPWPFQPSEDNPVQGPGDRWAGWYLTDRIEDLIRSGHLVEIGGPGGEPIGSTGPDGAPVRRDPPAGPTVD